ncbi:hypothetical protein LEP1GSC060_1239 [Leptospira weilii serovar Ranarum str. ICFT]|uniref:Uncharacterized protein n=1 Tax=Leptospira weilii serovar Ranarum str. ICFT TaxID=1218598 RepID=N1WJT8_9LEPT|nr:hypothetical protein LEP1GSC060_1239 [Leptospira weilii serovar Ranarum str. ICFT]
MVKSQVSGLAGKLETFVFTKLGLYEVHPQKKSAAKIRNTETFFMNSLNQNIFSI